MSYTIKARYYAYSDQFGESYVITSDNSENDTKLEVGQRVLITQNLSPFSANDNNGRDIGDQKSKQKTHIKEQKIR